MDALAADMGDAGFALPASDAAPLPWTNLDQATVRFTEFVIVARDALRLRGQRIADYVIRDFSYDITAHTAT